MAKKGEGTSQVEVAALGPRPLNELTALSPLDGRYWPQVERLSYFFGEEALVRTRVEVESRYLIALSEAKNRDGSSANLVRPLTTSERDMLLALGPSLTLEQVARVKEIEAKERHDVKAMELGLKELLGATTLNDVLEMVHFGLTSEDVNNTAYRLMLDRARREIMVPAANTVVDHLANAAQEYRSVPMLARTHGQPAEPTTLGKEMAVFAHRLQQQIRRLQDVQLTGKLNGAVGNFTDHMIAAPDVDWIDFSQRFIESLGFRPNMITNQINSPDDIIELLDAYKGVSGALLDIDIDMWLYIKDAWFIQKVNKGETGSSVMPQKVNPINFENSEGNSGWARFLFDALGHGIVTSRLQRDLSNSTVLRNLGVVLGHALVGYQNTLEGLNRVRPDLDEISSSLNEDWSIMTGSVQTVLRREAVQGAYDLVKGLVRGQKVTPEQWIEWVTKLPADIEDDVRAKLLALTPDACIGEAERLTDMAIQGIQQLRAA